MIHIIAMKWSDMAAEISLWWNIKTAHISIAETTHYDIKAVKSKVMQLQHS